MANIYAGMNYGVHQYGSIANIPGIRSLGNGGGYRPYATGGITSGPYLAGEGRRSFPEFIIPTDPRYKNKASKLFMQLGSALGQSSSASLANHTSQLKKAAIRGYAASAARSGGATSGGLVVVNHAGDTKSYHFHGDLSFPNVRSGADAERFLSNLENLAGK
jgi:SLT domain-containing protein